MTTEKFNRVVTAILLVTMALSNAAIALACWLK